MTRRVLLVTNVFPPAIGGPATFIDRLAHGLAGDGLRVTVVCSSDAPRCPADAGRPFRVVRTPLIPRERYEVLIRARLFREMALHERIFVNGLEPYVLSAARALRKRYVLKVVGDTVWETARNRGETILDFDEFQVNPHEQARFTRDVDRRNRWVRQARHVVVPSEYLKTQVARWTGTASGITVIPNGVEPQARINGEPRSRQGLRVIFVGRLTNWKGVETAMLAAARVQDVRLDVVGDGPCLPPLVSLCDQLGLADRVTFVGRLTPDATQARMREADALVLTSLYEGLSHTVLEAMSLGLPCIASNRGGNPEVITHGVDGVLVPPEDVASLASAFDRLARCEQDRRRLGDEAHRKSTLFPFRDTVARTRDLLMAI